MTDLQPSQAVDAARKVLGERPAEVDREQLRDRIAARLHATFRADWHDEPAADCGPCQTRTVVVLDALWPLIESQQALITSGHAALEAVLAYNDELLAIVNYDWEKHDRDLKESTDRFLRAERAKRRQP